MAYTLRTKWSEANTSEGPSVHHLTTQNRPWGEWKDVPVEVLAENQTPQALTLQLEFRRCRQRPLLLYYITKGAVHTFRKAKAQALLRSWHTGQFCSFPSLNAASSGPALRSSPSLTTSPLSRMSHTRISSHTADTEQGRKTINHLSPLRVLPSSAKPEDLWRQQWHSNHRCQPRTWELQVGTGFLRTHFIIITWSYANCTMAVW